MSTPLILYSSMELKATKFTLQSEESGIHESEIQNESELRKVNE